MKNILFVLCMLLLKGVTCHAQQINPKSAALVWEIESLYDLNYDTLTSYSSSFVTYDQSKIAWIQGGGEFIIEFRIQSSKGNWSDVNSDGALVYRTSLDGKSGNLTFERRNGKVSIRMDFPDDGKNRFPYVFNVSSITPKS